MSVSYLRLKEMQSVISANGYRFWASPEEVTHMPHGWDFKFLKWWKIKRRPSFVDESKENVVALWDFIGGLLSASSRFSEGWQRSAIASKHFTSFICSTCNTGDPGAAVLVTVPSSCQVSFNTVLRNIHSHVAKPPILTSRGFHMRLWILISESYLILSL